MRVYRIDHYLGKETVLNLLALRFANSLFVNNWDNRTIDHVEITVAEEVGIEGRWGYFDKAGQMRDMIQNHLLQILCMIAMSPPSDLSADSIRDEKVKVLKSLRRIDRSNVREKTVRGQYTAGFARGQKVPGYLEEEGAKPRAAIQKPSWRSASTLITGAGPVCHSTCVLVNVCRPNALKSWSISKHLN